MKFLPYSFVSCSYKEENKNISCALQELNIPLEGQWYLTCVLSTQKIIGWSLSQFFSETQSAMITDLFVLPFYRNQHIGRKLLNESKGYLRQQGIYAISFRYITSEWPVKKNMNAVEKMLLKTHWDAIHPVLLTAYFHINQPPPFLISFEGPILGIEEKMWSQLLEKEKENLYIQNKFLPETIGFPKENEGIEPSNSIVAYHQGKAIGWIITHRIDENTIRYTHFYVTPSFRKTTLFFSLLANAVKKQIKNRIPVSFFQLSYLQAPHRWQKFLEKHFLPYAIEKNWCIEAYEASLFYSEKHRKMSK